MAKPRILIVEASQQDLRLLLDELSRAHVPWKTRAVASLQELGPALDEFGPDLVIADYRLEECDVLPVLSLVRERRGDAPVVILTHALDQETAIDCLKHGAADCVLKSRLPSIIPVVTSLLERRKLTAEKTLLAREHEQLFKLTPNLFCITDLEGRFLEINPAWQSRLDQPREILLGRPLSTFVHPEDLPGFAAWWDELTQAGPRDPVPAEFECRMSHRNGGIRHIVWNATAFAGESRVYSYGHDVTERKQVEAALRESEARFRSMADSAPVLMWVADPELRFTYFNRPWLEFTGGTLSQELSSGWTRGVHTEDLPRCLEVLQASNLARIPFRMLFRLRRSDGEYRWILDYGMPRFDQHGIFLGYIGSCIDITEQHEAEAALTQRAVKQTALVNFSSFALARHPFSTLLAGAVRTVADTLAIEIALVLSVNQDRTTLSLAASAEPEADAELLGQPYCDAHEAMFSGRMLILPDDAEHFPAAAQLARRGVRAGLAVIIGSSEKPHALLIAATSQPIELTGDTASFLQSIANILSTVHARTLAEDALAESEQKLLQSQKMEAVGLLAGGVAHDFNNLLTAIRCYAEILNDDLLEQAPAAQPKVSEILKATARASALTRQLLAFSRKQVVQPEVMNLNHVITDISDILRSLLSENIVFDNELQSESANIRADRGQMEQVIINLAINARDAMPQGGRLTLRTERRLLTSQDEDTRDLPPGNYICLSVSDTGVGMSSEVQAHLFQPFFTTKPKGRGTGLGLATCSVILKNTGGGIRCSSRLGEGTSFHVLLPEVSESEYHFEYQEEEMPGGRAERILLVEDDEAVRTITANILCTLGYEVHAEPGGPEALALCLGGGAPHFDLLVTDIVMPYIGGHELAERLTALRPGLRVLFMSGFVDDPAVLRAVQDSDMPFLEKPFNRQTLAKKLREALEGR